MSRIAPRARLAAALLAAIACTAAARAAPAQPSRAVLPDDVVPVEYRVDITPDAAALRFAGRVDIDVDVRRPTDRIVLNALDLVIDEAALAGESAAPRIRYDKGAQTATLTLAHRIAPGAHTLTLGYHGRILERAAGLFVLKYGTPEGERSALYTQFETADARRFLPCWDEPGRKAVFKLSATVPAGQMAVSNMPVEAAEPLAGERQHVRFAASPRMSSYLLYFSAGDFERVHRDVHGVDVGVVVKRGDLPRAAYALEAAAQILPWYDEFFGVPYPLPKLDLVAAPGGSGVFGAMENWGAILFFERWSLVDPATSTQADRRNVYATIAHEMAHQWFGDLVTMAWWDDIWLNEGFASWMQTKAMERFHPEWKPWLDTLSWREEVMGTDARLGTHPIVTPIHDVLQAGTAFDDITYGKGQQAIRTVETYAGEDAFRDGVRRYMKRHAYGNTVSDDLWHAIDAGAAQPVAAVARDLTLQAGVPMVVERAATCVDGRTRLELAQSHYVIDPASTAARAWNLPVMVAPVGGAATRVLLHGPAPQVVTVPGCDAVILNAGQGTYARSLYAPPAFDKLLARYGALSAQDQLGILNDASSLALQGALPIPAMMSLLAHVPVDADPLVLSALAKQAMALDRLHDGLPAQAAWRGFAGGLLRPMLAGIGTRRRPDDAANTVRLRADLQAALGRMDDPDVLADARALFEQLAAGPEDALDAEQREFAVSTMALHADAATWDTLHRLAREAKTNLIRQQLYDHLAGARDPALAARGLALALSDEPPKTELEGMLASAARQHPALAFEAVNAHWAEIAPRLDPSESTWFVPLLVGDSPDPALAARLRAFANAHIPASARRDTAKALSNMRYQQRIREERLPDIGRWLAQAQPPSGRAATPAAGGR